MIWSRQFRVILIAVVAIAITKCTVETRYTPPETFQNFRNSEKDIIARV